MSRSNAFPAASSPQGRWNSSFGYGGVFLGAVFLFLTAFDVSAQDASGWKPLFKDERDMKKQTDGNFSMKDGLIYTPGWGPKDFQRQPSPDAAIRVKIHLKASTLWPTVMLRSSEDGKDYYGVGFMGRPEELKSYRGITIIRRKDDLVFRFPEYAPEKPFEPGDVVEVEFSVVGATLTLAVNGQIVSTVQDEQLKDPGHWGLRAATDGYFSDLEVQDLGPGSSLPNRVVAPANIPAPPTPPATEPAMATPVPSGTPTEADPKLAALEKQFADTYDEEVGKPIADLVAALNTSYLGAIDRAMTTATQANQLDDAVALRDEKQRVTAGEPLPPLDDEKLPASVKSLRDTYRKQIAAYEEQRSAKSRPVFAQYANALDGLQASFTQQNKLDEALKVRAVRDQLVARAKAMALPGATTVK